MWRSRHVNRRVIGVLMGFSVAIGACGGGESDSSASKDSSKDPSAGVTKFCGLVKEFAENQAGRDSAGNSIDLETADYNTKIAFLNRATNLFLEVPAATPLSLRAEMAVITSIHPDSSSISESQRRRAAEATAGAYVAAECDLRFSFKGLDFATS